MSIFLSHHVQAIKLVVMRMQNNKLSTFMISLVIGAALCLPSLFYIGVNNLSQLTNHMQNETEISLFVKLDASAKTINSIGQALAKNDSIQEFHLVSKDQAWEKLKSQSENNNETSGVVNELNKNPLPDAFFIQAKSTDPIALEALRVELQSISGVDQALLNAEWAKRLSTLLALSKKIIALISLLLALALMVIIGNTVRMQILTQKDEIEVSNLMGATTSFIRVPFLYAGILYGAFGGLLAILIVISVLQIFNDSITQISNLYSSDFSLPLFNGPLFLTIIVSAIFIGWLGSYLAVSRAITSFKFN